MSHDRVSGTHTVGGATVSGDLPSSFEHQFLTPVRSKNLAAIEAEASVRTHHSNAAND
jgi:hypothetical protein